MNMPTVGCVGESIIGNDERGLWFLSHKDDPSQMNWVEGEKCWGSVKVPMGLNVTRTLSVLENGELETAPMDYKAWKTTGKKEFYDRIRTLLTEEIKELSGDIDLTQNRYDRFRNLGVSAVIKE